LDIQDGCLVNYAFLLAEILKISKITCVMELFYDMNVPDD
jgi:hypothetical protein